MIKIFKSVFLKECIYAWRYKTNTITSIMVVSLICIGITSSTRFATLMSLSGGSKLSLVAPFFVWMVMMYNFNSISDGVSADCTTGIMEQIYINTKSYIRILIYRAISSFIINMIPLSVLLIVISAFTHINIQPFVQVLPVLILGIPSIWGVALVAGGLVLRIKQAGTLVSIISTLLFMSMSFFPINNFWCDYLPFSYACRLSITKIKNPGFEIGIQDICVILINSIVYAIVGIAIFKLAEYKTKQRGKLGTH